MRQRLVAGNWKMNGSREFAADYVASIKQQATDLTAKVAICVSFLHIPYISTELSGSDIAFGAQNLNENADGAFTGEVSPGMLKDFSCEYVIVGHSERRAMYGETDEVVAKKFSAAVEAGLTPILCVGETLEQREAGVTESVVEQQLKAVIDHCGIEAFAKAVIAYEPVWAIGTGKTATPDQAQEVHQFIRERLAKENISVSQKIQILYGGSMKPNNAAELLAKDDIDGGLVGGASLKVEDFLTIARA